MPPGTLFVVATPIGNLEDITLRALRVVKSVAVVAAEDTRRTGNLLRHYEIKTPILSVHEHNERLRIPKVLAELKAGRAVALATMAARPAKRIMFSPPVQGYGASKCSREARRCRMLRTGCSRPTCGHERRSRRQTAYNEPA